MEEIKTEEELNAALKTSEHEPIFLFKHSVTCPISAAADREVEDYLREAANFAPKFYKIIIQQARPISNAVAEKLGVEHESPQLLLVHGRQAKWHASHRDIDRAEITDAVHQHSGK